jgi:TIR domain
MKPLKVFLSYRREDTGGHAGRLYDALAGRFGADNVFMDVDTIDLGVDFAETVKSAVSACDVTIALIGREWLTAADPDGRRRLDDPQDFVRLEVEGALASDAVIVPTTVEGASIPGEDELPPSLAPLALRQGIELRDTAWHEDVDRLSRRLLRVADKRSKDRAVAPTAPRPSRLRALGLRGRRLAAAVLVLAALVGGALAAIVALGGSGGAGFSKAAERRLLATINPAVRPSCNPISWGVASALITLECSGAHSSVDYHLFANNSVLAAAYGLIRDDKGIAPNGGPCTADSFSGDAPYSLGGKKVGRYFCYLDKDQPNLVATDTRVSVGLEAGVYEGPGRVAEEKSLLRQWRSYLHTEPPTG